MLVLSIFCFAALIVLAIVGESILPLYGGNQELAERGSKASFALLGGVGFAFAQPSIWGSFAKGLQRSIAAGGSKSRLAIMLTQPGFISGVHATALLLCLGFLIATTILTVQLWRGHW